MSWESSIEYYRMINEMTKAKLGGLHSAQSVMYSVDFATVEALQHKERWQEIGQLMIDAAQRIERAGADFVVLCTNTMHKVAEEMQANIHIPLLHIADATADRIRAAGMQTVGLLGTRFTMEQDFYRGRLAQRHGLEIYIPPEEERAIAHHIIYNELCLGIINPESRAQYRRMMEQLVTAGAEGIILGCTEIELLVHPEDCPVPLFPTSRIHAAAAVEMALQD